MAQRSEKRDAAKAEYLELLKKGEKVNLRELAERLGVTYQLLRNWKNKDKWDDEKPKRKRGGQPGNKNCQDKQNAKGKGAPKHNKNAEKDGAYSAIFFDMLGEKEKEIAQNAPLKSHEALENEMQILKVREHRILEKIAKYEGVDEDTLYLSSVTDMRIPTKSADGARQQMGMYNKDSAFTRVLKLEEALYKVQGRIATIANALKSLEESDVHIEIEKRRLDIMYMRATGTVEIDDPAAGLFEDMEGDVK